MCLENVNVTRDKRATTLLKSGEKRGNKCNEDSRGDDPPEEGESTLKDITGSVDTTEVPE